MWANPASKPVLCLLGAALAVRIGAALAVQYWLDNRWQRQFVIEGDAEGYWMLGQAIAERAPYAAYEPPRYVMRMPGFPLLLAIPNRLAGGSFLAARLFLAVIGTAACGLVYLLGKELCDERIGLLAGWFAAVSPALAGFSVMILSETPFALGILASLWGMTRLMRAVSTETSDLHALLGWSTLTGASIALATYMRPSWLPAAGLFPLGLILARGLRRESLFAGGVMAATVLFALLPWGIRNHNVTGHWVFTTLWSGPSLYDGLNPEADGSSNMEFMTRDDLSTRNERISSQSALLGQRGEIRPRQSRPRGPTRFLQALPILEDLALGRRGGESCRSPGDLSFHHRLIRWRGLRDLASSPKCFAARDHAWPGSVLCDAACGVCRIDSLSVAGGISLGRDRGRGVVSVLFCKAAAGRRCLMICRQTLRKTLKWFAAIVFLLAAAAGGYGYWLWHHCDEYLLKILIAKQQELAPDWDVEIGRAHFDWHRRVHIYDVKIKARGQKRTILTLPEVVAAIDREKFEREQKIDIQSVQRKKRGRGPLPGCRRQMELAGPVDARAVPSQPARMDNREKARSS